LLIKDVVDGYRGQVRFVSENWGESKLADRYGVKRYPAVFVNDILIAGPDDFGWLGAKGKYTPWREEANHQKFKNDLTRMIDLVRGGHNTLAAAGRTTTLEEPELTSLPVFSAHDLEGQQIDGRSLNGRIVVVEMWATWCPPCRTTLAFLGDIKRRYGNKVVVVAFAVESEESQVRELATSLKLPVSIVMGTNDLVLPFGTLGSVPRLFVFDEQGKTAGIYYGAPPDLHEKIGALITSLAQAEQQGNR
jgi:thiol-disulfide isomerase/thioredoxin